MPHKSSSSAFTESHPPEPAVGPPLIGALLRVPLEEVRRRMLQRLREGGFDDLEPAHLIVLQYPGPHGSRPSDLAAQLQMSKQALNYLLGQLEARGYLERQADSGDLRAKRIALTARGRSVIPVIRKAVADVEADWAQRLGPQRFAELRGLLVDLNDVM